MALSVNDLTKFAANHLREAAEHVDEMNARFTTHDDELRANINTHISAAQQALDLLRSFGSRRLGEEVK